MEATPDRQVRALSMSGQIVPPPHQPVGRRVDRPNL